MIHLSSNVLAVVVAFGALLLSLVQWWESRRANMLRLLLGEKETVAFAAIRIARRPRKRIDEDTIRALMLSTLFEGSDRARIQVYNALEAMHARHRAMIIAFRAELGAAKDRYQSVLDTASYVKRLSQLDAALPWVLGAAAQPRP